MPERFIGQAITPVPGSISCEGMAAGAPSLPAQFTWNKRQFEISEVLQTWKESGPCRSGGGERYTRKHWFHVRTSDGIEMKLYFDRQPRSRQKIRWHLHTIVEDQGGHPG